MLLKVLTATADSTGGYSSFIILIAMFAVMYFVLILPQKKEQKQKAALLSAMSVGDSVRTTSGMFGTIIDISEDMVIIEFGNNKNCRIPMVKDAIIAVEKPEDALQKASQGSNTANDKEEKKGFGLFNKKKEEA